MSEVSSKSDLGLAEMRLGIEASQGFELPERVARGLGRTTIIGRTETGQIITAEGVLVAEKARQNQQPANGIEI